MPDARLARRPHLQDSAAGFDARFDLTGFLAESTKEYKTVVKEAITELPDGPKLLSEIQEEYHESPESELGGCGVE
jgi:hypothetical protein